MIKNFLSQHKKKSIVLFTILFSISILLFLIDKNHKSTTENKFGKKIEIVASVKTIKLHKRDFLTKIKAYGRVTIMPYYLKSYSFNFPVVINSISVNKGQYVNKGDILLTAKPAPNTMFQFKKLKVLVKSLKAKHAIIIEKFKLKLATKQELISSELKLKDAELQLDNIEAQGVNDILNVFAKTSGIISSININLGKITPQRETLLTLTPTNNIRINFGVEVIDSKLLKIGQQIEIQQIGKSNNSAITGKIQSIASIIDPSTRLVTINAIPDSLKNLMLNSFVNVNIDIVHKSVFVVPKSAVLPEGKQYVLYTTKNNVAIRHTVQINFSNNDFVSITGNDLAENNLVVILGNYELQNGMKTRELK